MEATVEAQGISKSYRVNRGRPNEPATVRAFLLDLIRAPVHRLRYGAMHSMKTREFWALEDISFCVSPGEVLGIVGRNGAGKSTLLRILSRITEPTHGEAVVHGTLSSLLEVGTGFHPDLSGRENVYLNGAILGMRRREINAKFDDIVDFSGVSQFIDTPVKRYSTGMRVRLGFAVAAHLEPDVLIVDEVLAVGDAEFQQRCLGKMDDVAKSGRTVIFVSHNMGAILRLTTRCLLIEHGRLVAEGGPQDVVDRYLALNNAAATVSRDLAEETRSGNCGSRWRFRRVSLRNQRHPLAIDDDLVLAFEFESDDCVDDVCVGVGVCNFAGTRVLTALTAQDNVAICSQAGETGTLEVRIPRPRLSPGRYIVQVGAHSGVQSQLDYVPDALCFEVRADESCCAWLQNRPNLGIVPSVCWSRSGTPSKALEAV